MSLQPPKHPPEKSAKQPPSGAFSIKAWCKFRGYSVATFYKMKRNGVAPKVTQPPGAAANHAGLTVWSRRSCLSELRWETNPPPGQSTKITG